MSSSPQEVDVLKLSKSSRKTFDEILLLADDLLKDECPISQVEEWLYSIDDTLLQLKLWGERVGVERGLLEDIVPDKDLYLVIGEVLRSVLVPLHKIKVWCEDSEMVKVPQIKSRIYAAIDEFQDIANSLTDTTELFQNYKAKSNNESFLQGFKPTGAITKYLYGADSYRGQDFGQKAEEEGQHNSWLPSQPVEDSSYVIFLHELGKMSDQEKQVIRFGELPILSEQIFSKIPSLVYNRANKSRMMGYKKEEQEILEVAATLSQFYQAWLEATSTMDFAGSDAMSRAHRLPLMAKIWLIVHHMRSDHLLDSFGASRMTDESLPLDILTLESILPNDEELYPSRFYLMQFDSTGDPGMSRFRRKLWCAIHDKIHKAPSVNLPRETLPGEPLAGTETPNVNPPVKETALNQLASTKKTFASTSSSSGGSAVEETALNRPAPTKKGFGSPSSHSYDPMGDRH